MNEETTGRPPGDVAARFAGDEPDVRHVLEADVATITLVGELTEPARRPLVRTMTDLLLGVPTLKEVRLDLRGVSFMNSAGLAVLVQLQRMGQPRAVGVVLVAPPQSVIRPLQLSGLWHRFPVLEQNGS